MRGFATTTCVVWLAACAEVTPPQRSEGDALVGRVVPPGSAPWSSATGGEDVAMQVSDAAPTDGPPPAPTEQPTEPPTDAPPPAPTAPPTDAPLPAPREETCNGVDDDNDRVVDDGDVCGAFVQARCRLWAGWADSDLGPTNASPTWYDCPPADESEGDNLACTSTRGDGRFARLGLNGNVDGDDQLALALTCDDTPDGVGAWVQSKCQVFLGHADENNGAADGAAAWGGCPGAPNPSSGPLRCTSTGGDAQFRALNLQGDTDGNDDLGLAWRCDDPADPARAEAVTGAVRVWMGWADNHNAPDTGADVWGTCPVEVQTERGEVRCVGSAGDGRFHRLNLGGDVDDNDDLGFALRAAP